MISTPVTTRTWIQRAIAVAATIGIAYQNQALVTAFVWAAIHGAGFASVLAFFPALAAAAVVWGGYIVLRRRRVRHGMAALATLALVVLLLNEALLPATPLKVWRSRRTIAQIETGNVRDEPFLTARGHPIGIRITFDAVFPRKGPYWIAPTALMPIDGEFPYELQFGHFGQTSPSTSPPSARDESGAEVFEQGIVYTLTFDLLPNFVRFDDGTKNPCLNFTPRQALSEKDFLSALGRNTATRYATDIEVDAPRFPTTRHSAARYVTHTAYDVLAMYRTIALEGYERCTH